MDRLVIKRDANSIEGYLGIARYPGSRLGFRGASGTAGDLESNCQWVKIVSNDSERVESQVWRRRS